MAQYKTEFEDTCEIMCIDTGVKVTADILDFVEEKFVNVSVNKMTRINMHYDVHCELYIGKTAGLEFKTEGPHKHTVRITR